LRASATRVARALRPNVHRVWLTLVAIPTLAFSVPALAGRPLINGDNLIQNYPLRVLVGSALRQGHLPLWDMYLASGTPLLAGFNAAAAYPATWLFAVVPSKLAWAISQIAVYVSAALGMYVFFRVLSMMRGVAALGAATFAFSGFMASQIVHLDLVTGAGLIPWALVAVHQIATRSSAGGAWGWAALLAASVALILLAGSPEAALYGSVAVTIYAVSLLWRHRDQALPILVRYLTGLAVGVALAGVQVVPGLAFAAHSQRASSTFAFFSSGSLQPRLTITALVPYILGGYGRFGVPQYMGPWGLSEVNTYVGFLPLVATFALLSRRWWRHPSASEYRVWYAVVAVGLLLAVGTFTPLGQLLSHIPAYGSQRLQNRNLLEVDLGLSVLFASWLQRVCSPAERYELPPRLPPNRLRHRMSQFLPTVPVLAIASIFVVFLFWGTSLEHSLGAVIPTPDPLPGMRPYLGFTLVLAIVGGALAVGYRRIRVDQRVRVFAAFVVVDLLAFTANQSILAVAPVHVINADTVEMRQLQAAIPAGSRYAIYDPDLHDYPAYLRSGAPDLNILSHLLAVQGYGSLVQGTYQAATGAHDQAALFPSVLRRDTLDRLDLALLVVRPEYFYRQISVPNGRDLPATPPSVSSTLSAPPPSSPSLPPLRPGGRRTWYFGDSLLVTQASVRPLGAHAPSPGAIEIGLRTPDGSVDWAKASQLTVAGDGTVTARFGREVAANAIVVTDLSAASLRLDAPQAATVAKGDIVLDGALQEDVKPPHWVYEGSVGMFALFANTEAKGRAWVEDGHGNAVADAAVRLRGDDGFGSQTFTVVSPRPGVLVRSVAAAPGWSAHVVTGKSQATTQPVSSDGIVQQVAVPAGASTVTFVYHPATVTAGIVVSSLALTVSLVFGVIWLVRRRVRARGRDGY
jgi:hypothetical protein